jgi:hypothetical protein
VKNSVSMKETRTLMIGKFAALPVLAVLAMIFVTPLMANPAMCGRNPLPGHWTLVQAIDGFTQNKDGSIATFTTAKIQSIRLGSWVEVKQVDANGKTVHDLPVVVVKATYNKTKKNYELISFNDALQSKDAWQVNFSVDKVEGCSPTLSPCTIPRLAATDQTVTLDNPTPIVDTKLDPVSNKAPIMLGSFVQVNLNGKKMAAAMIGSIIQHINTKLGGYARGYIPPSDSMPNGQLVKITITQDMMNQVKNGIKASGGNPSGW